MTPKQIRRLGTALLVAGLVAGAVIAVVAKPEEPLNILGVDIRTNRDRMQLERMGGKSYVLLKDFEEWFDTLWHGRRLGGTIAVLSTVGFLLCRGLAHVEENAPKSDSRDRSAHEQKPGPPRG